MSVYQVRPLWSVVTDRKPWQRPLPDEEREEFLRRLTHSCYRCGHREGDLDALAEHEDRCAGAGT